MQRYLYADSMSKFTRRARHQDAQLTTPTPDRRVHCDRVVPICSQCSVSKLKCKGYALRLSWPSAGDRRRSMAVKAPLHSPSRARPVSKHLAHVSFWDVQMHRHLTALGHPRPLLQIPMSWNSSELELGSNDLILYCVFHQPHNQ